MKKRFSVVIPLFNHARYIEQTLDSIRTQTLPPFEVVVVDDGSTDGGDRLCEKCLKGWNGAKMVRQANQGAHKAINNGIRYATGDVIAVLNSDDLFEVGKLERCESIFQEHRGVEFIFGDVGIINDDGREVRSGETVEWLGRASAFLDRSQWLPLALANENFATTTSNMVFSKALWQRAHGFQDLRYCHDMDFILTAMRLGGYHYDRGGRHIRYRVHARNTIKEDLSRIRLEIGAVLASAITEGGLQVFGGPMDAARARLVGEFLQNKGMSGLLVALMGMYISGSGRGDFYAMLARDDMKRNLIDAFLN